MQPCSVVTIHVDASGVAGESSVQAGLPRTPGPSFLPCVHACQRATPRPARSVGLLAVAVLNGSVGAQSD